MNRDSWKLVEMQSIRRVITLIIFVIIVAVVEVLGSSATDLTVETWYKSLALPAWRPPNFAFGPIWIVLYLLIAFSGYLFWVSPKSKNRTLAFTFWCIQLVLNGAWSFLFFGMMNPALAGIDILLILLFVILTIIFGWKKHRWAAVLLIPYLFWIIFATVLNWEIVFLNY